MPQDHLRDDALYRVFERKYHDALTAPSTSAVRALGEALKHVLMDIYHRLSSVERFHKSE